MAHPHRPDIGSSCAVVLGMGPTALAIVRELGRHGTPVYGVGLSSCEVSFHSRYCRKIAAVDPRENPEGLCVTLEEFAASSGAAQRVLYPSGDECVEFMARYAPRLKPHYRFSAMDAETCDRFLNKRKFYHLCRSAHVPTIETLFPGCYDSALSMAASLKFPCFVKPIYYHTWAQEYGLRKGFLCRTREEYARTIDRVAEVIDNVMIQEVVEGPEDNLRFVITYIARDGTPQGHFTGKKLRQYPPDFGTGSAVVSSPQPQIIEAAIQLLQAAGYQGLAEIEFKWCSKSHRFKAVEVNIRPCRLSGLASAAGVDLIYCSFLDLTGRRMPVLPAQVNGIKWLFPARDVPTIIHNVRHKRLTIAQAVRSYHKPRTWCIWARDDRMPFFAYLGEMFVKAARHYLLPRGTRPPAPRELMKDDGSLIIEEQSPPLVSPIDQASSVNNHHSTAALTIDVEDWFHILDSNAVPTLERWSALEDRVAGNMARLLDVLDAHGVHATFFWLGWVAQRHKPLVRRCLEAGHEIASHGYAHVLPHRVGAAQFHRDIVRAKNCLQDIAGTEVHGFRTPGFGVTEATLWAFDVIREAGYTYDASVFPGRHGHGGLPFAPLAPHVVKTRNGGLFEIPISVVEVLHRRVNLFGGGYLRLAPQAMIKWGIGRLKAEGRPLIVYLHPRDIDPDQPRLSLPPVRRFKCYVNLRSAFDKVEWLCENHSFGTMHDLMNICLAQSSMPVEVSPAGACEAEVSGSIQPRI